MCVCGHAVPKKPQVADAKQCQAMHSSAGRAASAKLTLSLHSVPRHMRPHAAGHGHRCGGRQCIIVIIICCAGAWLAPHRTSHQCACSGEDTQPVLWSGQVRSAAHSIQTMASVSLSLSLSRLRSHTPHQGQATRQTCAASGLRPTELSCMAINHAITAYQLRLRL